MEADQLPILEIVPELLQKLAAQPAVVLQAPPGAGKSTYLPLPILEQPWLQGKKILMLEPRRLAARAVAARLAHNQGTALGDTIGYRVRFESKVSKATQLEILTEGILTRMIQSDPALEEVGLVIFDEFHERSLHADLALVLCRQIQEFLRDDLKILVMSATLDTEYLSKCLGNAPIVTSKGRQFPISYHYLDYPKEGRLAPKMAKAIKTALREQEGDILAFLPGAADIKRTHEILAEDLPQISLHQLFGNLPFQEQQEALQPNASGKRKVVLSTSIAETSLTIQGIQIVVDSGFSRVARFNPRSGLTRLETVSVTADSAAQRAGRAGRLGPGVCYRLWAEAAHRYLEPQRKPEILSADLAPLRLEIAQWGIEDIYELGWPSQPPKSNVGQAEKLLQQLEALEEGKITEIGKTILRLPTHPRIAHMLLQGKESGLPGLAADLAALLEERDPFPHNSGVDLIDRLEELKKYRNKERFKGDRNRWNRIAQLARNWRRILKVREQSGANPEHEAGRLIAAAFPERIAKQLSKHSCVYRLSQGGRVSLHESDPLLRETWLAVAQMDSGHQEGRIYLAASIDPYSVEHLHSLEEKVKWDQESGRLLAREELRIGDLTVASHDLKQVSEAGKSKVICEAIRKKPSLLNWSKEVEGWLARMESLRLWRKDDNWPDLSRKYLLETLDSWLGPNLNPVHKASQLQKLELLALLKGIIPWDLATKIDQLAPSHQTIPSGSRVRLQYFEDGRSPILAARLQEMFGLLDTPKVDGGRKPVLVHLLTPAMRPAAVTQDLRSFWTSVYPEVRKELRGRYSKHYWPEDPFTAEAVRGIKRKGKK